jgi:hypothetical protein
MHMLFVCINIHFQNEPNRIIQKWTTHRNKKWNNTLSFIKYQTNLKSHWKAVINDYLIIKESGLIRQEYLMTEGGVIGFPFLIILIH